MASSSAGLILRHIHRLFGRGTLTGMTEAQLLERFVATRDEAAFTALVARHGPMVLAVCRHLLWDQADVEDAFQATFLVLVRKAAGLRYGDRLGSWLYGVAYRVAVRARAQAARRRQRERPAAELGETPVAHPDRPDHLDDLPALHAELNRLPAKYRDPLVLCYLEGQTHDQAAAALGWPVGTVRGRLARARDLLRGRLARRGVTLSAVVLGGLLAEPAAPAAVPPALLDATVRAAIGFAASPVAAAGGASASASASAISLMEGVCRTMFLNKLKLAAAVGLALGCALTGAGVAALQAPADRAPAAPATGTAPRARVQEGETPAAPVATQGDRDRADADPFADPDDDFLKREARNEIELLQVQLARKRAELQGEMASLEASQRRQATQARLKQTKAISEGAYEAAVLDATTQKARVRAKEAEVRELEARLEQAQQRLASPAWLRFHYGRASRAPADSDHERRIRALEQKVDELREDLARLKRK